MPTHKELLESLRDGFEQLELFDRPRLKSLQSRGQMIIGKVFGEDSSYKEQLVSKKFRYTGPSIRVLGAPETAEEKQLRERYWLAGQRESIDLVETMLEDLELSESEQQVQDGEDSAVPKSNRVFVVHGHDDVMKESVTRSLATLGLHPVILH